MPGTSNNHASAAATSSGRSGPAQRASQLGASPRRRHAPPQHVRGDADNGRSAGPRAPLPARPGRYSPLPHEGGPGRRALPRRQPQLPSAPCGGGRLGSATRWGRAGTAPPRRVSPPLPHKARPKNQETKWRPPAVSRDPLCAFRGPGERPPATAGRALGEEGAAGKRWGQGRAGPAGLGTFPREGSPPSRRAGRAGRRWRPFCACAEAKVGAPAAGGMEGPGRGGGGSHVPTPLPSPCPWASAARPG